MASGTIYGTTPNEYIQARITWTSTPNTATNTSTVTATLAYYKDSSKSNATYSRTFVGTIVINGNVHDIDLYDSDRIYLYRDLGWVTMGTYSITVEHNNNGTKNIAISATGYMSGTTFTSTTLSDTVALDTIPRASSITSAAAVTLGNKCSVKWTPLASSFAYKLKFACGGVSYTTGYISPGSTSAYTYTEYTMEVSKWAAAMPKAYSATCTVTLYTYQSSSSSSSIGSDSATFKLTLSSSVKPSVSFATPTLVDGWNGYYIQGKSKCTLSATFAAGTGSSISSCSISGTGLSKTGTSASLSGTTSILTKSGTFTYTAEVTDGRTSASATKSIYVYPYANPTLSLSAARTSTSGSVKITYKASCSSINSKNSLATIKIYKKLSTDSTYPSSAEKSITLSGLSVNTSVTLSGFELASSYDLKAVVTDAYGSSSAVATASVASEFRILNIRSSKKGIAFGKMAEEDNLFDCNLPAEFGSTLSAEGNITTNGYIGSTKDASSEFYIYCKGADDSSHQLLDRTNDLTASTTEIGIGWWGDDDYKTTCKIRTQNIEMSGVLTSSRGRFTAETDVAGDTQNNVPLRVGNANGTHLDIDGNEIQAKASPTTTGALRLNNDGGDVYASGWKIPIIQHGSIQITPSEADTPTSVDVTFSKAFPEKPHILLTPATAVPGMTVTGVGVSDVSTTGFTAWLTRTNTTVTTVYWMAICD